MIVFTTQGPRSKFLSEEGGGGGLFFFSSVIFIKLCFFKLIYLQLLPLRGPCYNEIWIAFVMLWYTSITTKTKPVVVIVSVALVPSGFPFRRSAKFNCRETYRWEHSFGSDGS